MVKKTADKISKRDVERTLKAPVKRSKRMMDSVFHMTLASNIRLKNFEHDERVRMTLDFARKLEGMFTDEAKVKSMIEIKPKEDSVDADVHYVRILGGIEYSQNSGLHAHLVIELYHTTDLRLHFPNIRELLGDEFPGRKIYMNANFVRNPVTRVRNYVTKTVKGNSYNVPEDIKDKMHDGFQLDTDINISESFNIDD